MKRIIKQRQPITKQRQIIQRSIDKKRKSIVIKPTNLIPKYSMSEKRMKIAIIQTGSWGDNINSTLMLKPLKQAYGDCIIDVHTSTLYGSAFHNNPYVDNIVSYNASQKDEALHLTLTIPEVIKSSGYDKIISAHPMFNHGNWNSIKHPELGDNLIYAWIRALEHENVEYEWPIETVLRLTDKEINNVNRFYNNIPTDRRKNIMEIHGESGQTFWDNAWTDAVINKLCSRGEVVFISHKIGVPNLAEKFNGLCFNVNHLTIRECAELFNRCDKFFSVSSGLSNACNTNWCRKDVEWVEVINSPTVSSAPIRSTGKTFWYENDLHKFISTL